MLFKGGGFFRAFINSESCGGASGLMLADLRIRSDVSNICIEVVNSYIYN